MDDLGHDFRIANLEVSRESLVNRVAKIEALVEQLQNEIQKLNWKLRQ